MSPVRLLLHKIVKLSVLTNVYSGSTISLERPHKSQHQKNGNVWSCLPASVWTASLSPVYRDTTQHNSTSSWVELCRYKRGFSSHLPTTAGDIPTQSDRSKITESTYLSELTTVSNVFNYVKCSCSVFTTALLKLTIIVFFASWCLYTVSHYHIKCLSSSVANQTSFKVILL